MVPLVIPGVSYETVRIPVYSTDESAMLIGYTQTRRWSLPAPYEIATPMSQQDAAAADTDTPTVVMRVPGTPSQGQGAQFAFNASKGTLTQVTSWVRFDWGGKMGAFEKIAAATVALGIAVGAAGAAGFGPFASQTTQTATVAAKTGTVTVGPLQPVAGTGLSALNNSGTVGFSSGEAAVAVSDAQVVDYGLGRMPAGQGLLATQSTKLGTISPTVSNIGLQAPSYLASGAPESLVSDFGTVSYSLADPAPLVPSGNPIAKQLAGGAGAVARTGQPAQVIDGVRAIRRIDNAIEAGKGVLAVGTTAAAVKNNRPSVERPNAQRPGQLGPSQSAQSGGFGGIAIAAVAAVGVFFLV